MRILHVASAFTPDNRFGGPTRVAVGLATELGRRGHDVVLMGAALDWAEVPSAVDGVPARLVQGFNPTPFLGWASLLAPGLRRALEDEMRRADVVHVHLARDVVTLTAALTARRLQVPYLVQTHGMIDAANGPLGRAVDGLATRRAIGGASVALTLTREELQVVARLTGGAVPAEIFPNGVAPAPDDPEPGGPLFLARLHPRKGAAAFARAAAAVAATRPDARFRIVGPDEGDGPAVRAAVDASAARDRIEVVGPVTPLEARRLLAGCAVYVLPAEREPFGMTVVEAMSGGRPVLLHASAVLADRVVAAGAGWTFGPGGTSPTLEHALGAVLDDPAAAEAAGVRARALVEDRYSIGGVTDLLLEHYGRMV